MIERVEKVGIGIFGDIKLDMGVKTGKFLGNWRKIAYNYAHGSMFFLRNGKG